MVLEFWKEAVVAYTKGSLTRPSDKLVAIAAIAREVQTFTRSRYYARLQEVELVHQLAWRCIDNTSSRAIEYRAPSWSWASVDGAIAPSDLYLCHDDTNCYPLIEMIKVKTDISGRDEFGQAQGGHLKLLGTIDRS